MTAHVALFGVIAALFLAYACDPGEHVFAITIRNDTASELEVRKCDAASACTKFHEDVHLKPGAEHPTNVTDLGNIQWFKILDARGQETGCLRTSFRSRRPGTVILVSAQVSCD